MGSLTLSRPDAGLLLVELDRPGGNLFTRSQCIELVDLLRNPPEEAHVLLFRASGDAFCLGREREAAPVPDELRSEALALAAVMHAMKQTPLVTVAEVQGDVAGFGIGLVASCNVAVAVEEARFSFPEVTFGLAPALVLAWLPRVVGEREAFWLTATGEAFSAEHARTLGLVNAVVSDVQELRRDVEKRVVELRSHNSRTHAEIKDMIRAFSGLSEENALEASVDRLVLGSLRLAKRS
jgi:methylglutaconyl-CoA hydratase